MEQEEPRQSPHGDHENDATPDPRVAFLRHEFNFPAIDLYIERKFAEAGFLTVLEDAGVLPVVADPNPFDPTHDETAYDLWWAAHPAEFDVYDQQSAERRTILKHLHIGALVAHLAGRNLYPGRDLPTT